MGNCSEKPDQLYEHETRHIMAPQPEFMRPVTDFHGEDTQSAQKSLRLHSNNTYEGDVKENKANGKGRFLTPEYEYVGEWINGRPNGVGEIVYVDGTRYSGQFINGMPDGRGEFVTPNGFRYIGEFHNGKFYGQGEAKWPDGSTYRGEFKLGLFHGLGEYTWSDGKVFTGNYRNGVKDGKGIIVLPNKQQFEGMWEAGQLLTDDRVKVNA